MCVWELCFEEKMEGRNTKAQTAPTGAPAGAGAGASTGAGQQAQVPRLWNAEMSDFFAALDKYHPTVPDAVVLHHLSKSGVNVKDPRIARLVALAADKFLAEIIYESKQSAILKKRNKGKDKRKLEEISECLQLSDLNQALQAKRISISRRIRENEE
jgi:hypothetical protein